MNPCRVRKEMSVKVRKRSVLIALYDMEIGGVERSLINMLECFDYDHYEVDVFVCSHSGDLLTLIPDRAQLLPEVKAYTSFRKSILQCLKERLFAAAALRLIAKVHAKVQAKLARQHVDVGFVQMQLSSRYANFFLPNMANK